MASAQLIKVRRLRCLNCGVEDEGFPDDISCIKCGSREFEELGEVVWHAIFLRCAACGWTARWIEEFDVRPQMKCKGCGCGEFIKLLKMHHPPPPPEVFSVLPPRLRGWKHKEIWARCLTGQPLDEVVNDVGTKLGVVQKQVRAMKRPGYLDAYGRRAIGLPIKHDGSPLPPRQPENNDGCSGRL